MKQYVIDELRPADVVALKSYLTDHYGQTEMDGVFWIPVKDKLLSDIQAAHHECRPHCFAVDLNDRRIACELLVRTRNRIRCDCISYATKGQRNWLIALVDDIFDRLAILT